MSIEYENFKEWYEEKERTKESVILSVMGIVNSAYCRGFADGNIESRKDVATSLVDTLVDNKLKGSIILNQIMRCIDDC